MAGDSSRIGGGKTVRAGERGDSDNTDDGMLRILRKRIELLNRDAALPSIQLSP